MKYKYIKVDCIREIVDENGETSLFESVEIIKLSLQIVNVYIKDLSYKNKTAICRLKFVSEGDDNTDSLYLDCTLEQSKKNIETIYSALNEMMHSVEAKNDIQISD